MTYALGLPDRALFGCRISKTFFLLFFLSRSHFCPFFPVLFGKKKNCPDWRTNPFLLDVLVNCRADDKGMYS